MTFKTRTITEKACLNNALNIRVSLHKKEDGRVAQINFDASRSGDCSKAFLDALSKVTNIALSLGADIADVAEAIRGIRCHSGDNENFNCCPHALALAINKYIKK